MRSDAEAFIQLALETLSCSQKELAARLGVSPTQISKWKNGEYMSSDMEDKLRAMVDIGDKNPSFVVWAGSLKEADKWERLILFLAEAANESSETGYDTSPLTDEPNLLCWQTFDTLRNMGVDLPKTFPSELDVDYEEEEDSDNLWDLIEANPYSSLIRRIYGSLTNVYGFYVAYVSDLDDKLENLWNTGAENIGPCLMDLAASKLEIADVEGLATKFREFSFQTQKDYGEWLNILKEEAFRAGVPLRAELLDMVHGSEEELRDKAEMESLGFNAARLHPDIYMDELLRGMRVIHQVLPAIIKKLGIEFQLDESALMHGPRSSTRRAKEENTPEDDRGGLLQ